MFQFAKLSEVMRQKGDAEFIKLLNKIRIGDIEVDVQQKLKPRFMNFQKISQIFFTITGYFTYCKVNCSE